MGWAASFPFRALEQVRPIGPVALMWAWPPPHSDVIALENRPVGAHEAKGLIVEKELERETDRPDFWISMAAERPDHRLPTDVSAVVGDSGWHPLFMKYLRTIANERGENPDRMLAYLVDRRNGQDDTADFVDLLKRYVHPGGDKPISWDPGWTKKKEEAGGVYRKFFELCDHEAESRLEDLYAEFTAGLTTRPKAPERLDDVLKSSDEIWIRSFRSALDPRHQWMLEYVLAYGSTSLTELGKLELLVKKYRYLFKDQLSASENVVDHRGDSIRLNDRCLGVLSAQWIAFARQQNAERRVTYK